VLELSHYQCDGMERNEACNSLCADEGRELPSSFILQLRVVTSHVLLTLVGTKDIAVNKAET
jgi:hypothetical protein